MSSKPRERLIQCEYLDNSFKNPTTKQTRVATDTVIQNQVTHDPVVSIVVRLVGQARKLDSGVSSFISMSLPSHGSMLITRPVSRLEEGGK